MRRTEGFTLVELIVVIAILGILAGIAIPVYTGYISKANEASDMQMLDAIKTAAAVEAASIHSPSAVVVRSITVNNGAVTWSGTVDGVSVRETLDLSGYGYSSVSFRSDTFLQNGAVWNSDSEKWTAGD